VAVLSARTVWERSCSRFETDPSGVVLAESLRCARGGAIGAALMALVPGAP
jgi:hypothetical protein